MKKYVFSIMFLLLVSGCEQTPKSVTDAAVFNGFIAEMKIDKASVTCQAAFSNYTCFGVTLNGTPVQFYCTGKNVGYVCYYGMI